MKKVLSLVLAIVMMASVLVVSTSAAAVDTTLTVGASGQAAAEANANVFKTGEVVVNNVRVAGPITVETLAGTFGTNGGAFSIYLDVETLFPGFDAAGVPAQFIPADYVNVALTSGYSIASMAYSVVDLDPAPLTAKPAIQLTVKPVTGYVNLVTANSLSIGVTFTHYKWNKTSDYAGAYVAQPTLTTTITYDVSDVATIKAISDYNKNTMFTAADGNVVSQATINSVAAQKGMLLWNNGRGLIPYNVAVLFQNVNGLTACNLGATVGTTYAGIDAPYNTMKVVSFLSNHTLGANALVSITLDPDFININGKDYNVYFIEEVEGASTTVKGAKATFVGKATYGADAAGAPIASFSLLNNKLGTYIVTAKTLDSGAAEAPEATPEVPNVNTGADNTVNVAIVLAVLALAAAGFVAVKKVK